MKLCNLDYLKSITPGSNTFSIQIINLFLEDTPKSILEIKNAISKSDWENVYNFAHKIKPSITILGLSPEINDTISKINEFSKDQINLDQINTLFTFFETEIEKTYSELQQELIELSI